MRFTFFTKKLQSGREQELLSVKDSEIEACDADARLTEF